MVFIEHQSQNFDLLSMMSITIFSAQVFGLVIGSCYAKKYRFESQFPVFIQLICLRFYQSFRTYSMMIQKKTFPQIILQQIMGLYDYNKVFQEFQTVLQRNSAKAASKKAQYLERIVTIFTQFVKKCQKEIDSILDKKIDKLYQNYTKVQEYIKTHEMESWMTKEQKDLLVAEFLIKPFERFPFSGNKNQKIFKEQYNLIEKASVLIEQTLIDSFNQDEVPTFSNNNFFKTIENQGLGSQSLTKLRLNPQNFRLKHVRDINPVMTSAKSIKILHQNLALIVGDSQNVQIWNLQKNICLKQFYVQVKSSINTFCKVTKIDRQSLEMQSSTIKKQQKTIQKQEFLIFGFSDELPQIWAYRMDNWKRYAHNVTHTRKVTKILQMSESNYLLSGGADGNLCVHSFSAYKIKTVVQAPHVSPIEDIIQKNNYVYILLKCSTVCEYELTMIQRINPNQLGNLVNNQNIQNQVNLQFRRTLSTGYISIIRFPQVTSNFSGVACHIYGLSQIEITRKFKLEQVNIINVVQMISDFIVLESKETSEFFAVCIFQNSSTIRIYSLLSQEVVYQLQNDDYNEVGVAGYLPKIQIFYSQNKKCYVIAIVLQSQRPNQRNILRLYDLMI